MQGFTVALIGRSLLGIGSEALQVSNSLALQAWFSGKELALAMSLVLSVSGSGSVLNNLLMPVVAE